MVNGENTTGTWDMSDSRRDASRYHKLLLALRRVTGEIRAMEEESQPEVDEVLARMLPDLAEALNAARAFVAVARESEAGGKPWFELTATYPRQPRRVYHLNGSAWLQQLVKDGKPRVIDPLGDPAPSFIPGLELFEATSAILARVQAGEQLYIVGVCNKAQPDPYPFLAADGLVLDNILELVAIGARVGGRRRRELESIQKTSAQISAELDLDKLLPVVAREAAEVFRAPAASVMLWDESGQNLVIRARWGLSDEYARHQSVPRERVETARKLIDIFKPVLTPDLQLAPFGSLELIQREGLRTVLSAPLLNDKRFDGVLNIYSKEKPRHFTPSERKLAQILASQAAIAVQNAQLFASTRSQARQLQDLLAASQNITALRPIRDVLQAITDSLVANSGYDAVTLFPYLVEAKSFEPPVVSGALRLPSKVLNKVNGHALVERLLTGPEFYFTSNTPGDELLSGPFAEREGISASGYVRLDVGTEVVGILFVNYRKAHSFTPDEQRAVRLFANQAAMAIHNTRQFAALQSQLGQLEMTLAASQGIMMQKPLRETLQDILDRLVRVEGYDMARLVLYRPLRGVFGYTLVAGQVRNYPKVMGHFPRGSVVERRLLEGPDEYFTSDAVHDPLLAGSFVTREGIRAAGSLRIKDGDQTVGLLFVNKREPHQFTAREQETLRLYAGQAAVAFHEARLFYRGQERIEMLIRIGREVGQSLQLEKVLDILYSQLRAIFGPDIDPGVLLYDETNQELHVPYPDRFGLRMDMADKVAPRTIKVGEGICGWVAEYKQALNVPDVNQDPRYLELLRTTQSELAVPILLGERLVGVLDIESPTPGKFSEDEQRLLEAVANQVAAAIRNAEQYEVLQDSQQRLQALHEAGKTIAMAGLDLKAVLQTILDQAVTVTGAYFGILQLVDGDMLTLEAAWPAGRLEALQYKIGRIPISGPGITARAVRQNQAQLVPDVSQDPDFKDVTGETGAELAVVLRRGGQREGQPIGVLNVEHRAVGGLSREDQNLLISLSNLAVVAIQNAEQYKELEDVRDYGLASEAVAWLGLFGADWQHTINQKTFSISNYVDALRRWLANNQAPAGLADVVYEALDGIEQVTDSIRTVQFTGRVPSETPSEMVGDTLIDPELQKTVSRWCCDREDVSQVYRLQCEDVRAKIPPQWLKVAMEKLVNNALKAMPEGGELTISTRQVETMVHITIEDTGHGIPDYALPHFLKGTIRRPEGSSDRGTGKGALIARFIARSYGGDLSLLHTAPGQGTRLLLTLPVLAGPAPDNG